MRKACYIVFLSLSLATQAEVMVWVLMKETSGNAGQHPRSLYRDWLHGLPSLDLGERVTIWHPLAAWWRPVIPGPTQMLFPLLPLVFTQVQCGTVEKEQLASSLGSLSRVSGGFGEPRLLDCSQDWVFSSSSFCSGMLEGGSQHLVVVGPGLLLCPGGPDPLPRTPRPSIGWKDIYENFTSSPPLETWLRYLNSVPMRWEKKHCSYSGK